MSIATQIARLRNLRDQLRTKILALGLDTDPALDLEDCVGIIEGISGTQDITDTSTVDVAGKQYARVSDEKLIPSNIIRGVTILGVTGTGTGSGTANIQRSKRWTYGGAAAPSTIYPDGGYDGIAQVVPVIESERPRLIASNIKNGATIMGVTGNYETPTETKSPTLTYLKNEGITSHSVNVTPSSGKHLSQVTIPQITSAIDDNIIAGNIRSGVSILNVQGTYGGGSSITNWVYLSGTLENSNRRLTFTSPLMPSSFNSAMVCLFGWSTHFLIGNLIYGIAGSFSATVNNQSNGVFSPYVLNANNSIINTGVSEYQYWSMYFNNGVFYIDMPPAWTEFFDNPAFNPGAFYSAYVYYGS